MGNIQINYALKHFEKCLCQVHLYFKESISHKSFLHKNAKSRILSNILNSYVIFLTIRNLQNLSKIYLQNFDTLCFKNLTPKYIFQFDIFIQHDYTLHDTITIKGNYTFIRNSNLQFIENPTDHLLTLSILLEGGVNEKILPICFFIVEKKTKMICGQFTQEVVFSQKLIF